MNIKINVNLNDFFKMDVNSIVSSNRDGAVGALAVSSIVFLQFVIDDKFCLGSRLINIITRGFARLNLAKKCSFKDENEYFFKLS